jgi:hypothetical protein
MAMVGGGYVAGGRLFDFDLMSKNCFSGESGFALICSLSYSDGSDAIQLNIYFIISINFVTLLTDISSV